MDNSWRALHVVANHEKRVAQHLKARSLEHYLPLFPQKSRWTDRTVILEKPLFPGYVFVRFAQQEKPAITSTPGVIQLVGNGPAAAISHIEIDSIREALAKGCRLQPHPHVTAGMHVRIRSGVFEGREGFVTAFRQSCKVVLVLSGVSQCFSLEMHIQDIEALTRTVRVDDSPLSQGTYLSSSVPLRERALQNWDM
jgi:transcriptional antiterminator RfaH